MELFYQIRVFAERGFPLVSCLAGSIVDIDGPKGSSGWTNLGLSEIEDASSESGLEIRLRVIRPYHLKYASEWQPL